MTPEPLNPDAPGDDCAARFELLFHRFWQPDAAAPDTADLLVRQLRLAPDARLLAIGCEVAAHAAALAGARIAVTLAEPSAETAARLRATTADLPIDYVVAALPAPAAPFDAAIGVADLIEQMDPEAAFAEIRRLAALLRPGARLILSAKLRFGAGGEPTRSRAGLEAMLGAAGLTPAGSCGDPFDAARIMLVLERH